MHSNENLLFMKCQSYHTIISAFQECSCNKEADSIQRGSGLCAMRMNITYNSTHEKRVLIGGSPTLDPESPFKEFNLNSIYSIYDFV